MGKQGGKRARVDGVRPLHVAAAAAAPPFDGAAGPGGDAKRMKPAPGGGASFSSRSSHEASRQAAAAPPPTQKPAHLGPAKPRLSAVAGAPLFSSLEVAAELKLAISEDLGFASMTPVQAATLPLILQGKDLLAKAKTGTGKTLAFLVPTLHRLLSHPRTHADAGPEGPIRALVLSPTRELAAQTQTEAIALLGRAGGRVRSALVVGGNKPGGDAARMRGPLDLLVATPGRLKDHCENTPGFSARLRGCETLILDEGDQLLAAGFMPDIQRILAHLTSPRRQSLCFSATIPPDLARVLGVALRPGHASVDCVGADAPDTHAKVPQSWALVEAADQLATVMRLVREEQASDPLAKIIIFFTTARQTQFGAEALNALGISCLEIHSRKSQAKRDAAAAAFRGAKAAVMASSDVSARGVDYPDVTLVIQLGVPSNREQYIHRLGRTGRAGKEGRGVLLLSPYEEFFVHKDLVGLPITPEPPHVPLTASERKEVDAAVQRVPMETRTSAYGAWLGFYNGMCGKLRWGKPELVSQANAYGAAAMGLLTPPPISAQTIGKMGLRGTPGLNVQKGESGWGGGGGGYTPPGQGRSGAGRDDGGRGGGPPGGRGGGRSGGGGRGGGGRGGGGGAPRRTMP